MPQPESLDQELAQELDTLQRAGLRRTLRRVHGRRGATIELDGRAAVDFASNDYLGLASDPRLAEAAVAALRADATGAAAARLVAGNHPMHEALEAQLARFKGVEAALVFTSGYAANIGAIPALAGRGDVIYADELNHASLNDGCRLARAETKTFPHADLEALESLLAADRGSFRRRFIVVDSVFSMDGDLFPLDQLVPLAHQHGAFTYIDDAHGTGVLGEGGRGAAAHWGVEGEIDVLMGTLGKALGVAGAFVAGSRTLVELLRHRARAWVYTTAQPPALAAAACAALDIAQGEPERRARLRTNIERLRAGLDRLGVMLPIGLAGHIVPIVLRESDITTRAGSLLRDRGYLVGAIRPPAVPLGTARLRVTVSAAHTDRQIDGLLSVLGEVLTQAREPGPAAQP